MKGSAVLLLTILVAGCGGTSGPGVSPSGSGAAASQSPVVSAGAGSVQPSTSPDVSTSPAAVAIRVDSIAKVVTSDLLVRSAPGTGANSKKLRPLLQNGDQIFVVRGPVAIDGYDWYQVQPLEYPRPFGWVAAAGHDGEPWLGDAGIQCPTPPLDVAAIAALVSYPKTHFGLACFGERPLTLTARLAMPEATCGVSAGWSIVPSWLEPCTPHDFLTTLTGDEMGVYFEAVFAPNVDLTRLPKYGIAPKTWRKVRVTGQFDYPAARTCRGVKQDIEPPPRPEIVLTCRDVFVITSIQAVP